MDILSVIARLALIGIAAYIINAFFHPFDGRHWSYSDPAAESFFNSVESFVPVTPRAEKTGVPLLGRFRVFNYAHLIPVWRTEVEFGFRVDGVFTPLTNHQLNEYLKLIPNMKPDFNHLGEFMNVEGPLGLLFFCGFCCAIIRFVFHTFRDLKNLFF